MLPVITLDQTLHHRPLEADLLAALLREKSPWPAVFLSVEPADFSDRSYQLLFEAMQAQGSVPVNFSLLSERHPELSPELISLKERQAPASSEVLARGLHTLGQMRRLSSAIDQSYRLQQRELRAMFPQDDLEDEREQADLNLEELEARETRRAELWEQAD